ncbi:MAG: hypothetical protein JSV52_14345 [Candidatus Zixiibacteriota bacterium]|nr:MAG: hypothetical protein JSV52_14345 [candidate division Zixibacteria bacterium]
MNHSILRILNVVMIAATLILACSRDDRHTPNEPVEPEDPPPIPEQIDMVWEQFQFMKIATSEMTQINFDCIGFVLDSMVAASKPGLTDLFEVSYYPDGHWWTFRADSFESETGITFFVFDSLQFRYERGPVQYPDWDSLASISNYSWYVPFDSTDLIGWTHQHLEISRATPGADTVLATGHGDYNLLFLDTDSPVSGRDHCELELNYWLPEIELFYDLSVTRPGDAIGCPFDGYIWYEGRIDLIWQDTVELLDSNWDVYQIHDDDTIRFDIIDIWSDSTHYEYIQSCE